MGERGVRYFYLCLQGNFLEGDLENLIKDNKNSYLWEEKGMTEDETVGWHHRLDGHEFEQDLGTDEGQGGLVSCSPWGHKESEKIEQLN